MELKMEVYTPGLELAGILEVYRSVLWEEYAFRAGSFSVEALITPESAALLVPENILWIAGETAGIIESIQESVGEEGPCLTVKGPLLTGLLERRILWGRYDLYGTPPALLYQLVEDCAVNPARGDAEQRKIPGLALDGDAPAGGESIRKQKTGGSLLEALEEIGEAHQTAFGVRLNPRLPQMEFWARRGVDRSVHQSANEPVFYSTELDDVLSSEYSYDASEYRNFVMVAGKGSGEDRILVTVSESKESARDLPNDYQRLKYIQSTGTQYINTGLCATTETRILLDCEILDTPTSTWGLFGSRDVNSAAADRMFSVLLQNNSRFRTEYFGTSVIVITISPTQRLKIEKNENLTVINGLMFENAKANSELTCAYPMGLFCLNIEGSFVWRLPMRLYSMHAYDNGIPQRNFIPCKNPKGVVGLYDSVNRKFYGNSGSGVFIAGDTDADSEPYGLFRRELYVDARDLQSDSNAENTMTEDQYKEALLTRGLEKLSEAQLVRSFSTVVRTHNPTYEYGVDFLLGDTITVTDERLNISVDAVVRGVERAVSREGEQMSLILGYAQPTLQERLRRKAER